MPHSTPTKKAARVAAAAAAAKRKTTKTKLTNHGAYAGFKNESFWAREKVAGKRKAKRTSIYTPGGEIRIKAQEKRLKVQDNEQNDFRNRVSSIVQADNSLDEEQAIAAALRAKTDSNKQLNGHERSMAVHLVKNRIMRRIAERLADNTLPIGDDDDDGYVFVFERNDIHLMMEKILAPGAVKSVADEIGVTERTLSNWTSSLIPRLGDLSHRKGAGAPFKHDHAVLNDALLEIAYDNHYELTYPIMQWELEQRGHKVGVATVWEVLKEFGWLKTKTMTRPYLTEEQMRARLKWVIQKEKQLDKEREQRVVRIYIDEKYFVALRNRKLIYVPPHVADDPNHPVFFTPVKNKRFPPKVMFIAAIAEPVLEHNFEGKIYFEPIGEWQPCLNTTKNFNAGGWKFASDTLNADGFRQHSTNIVAAAKKACPWATGFVMQFDGAGGHGMRNAEKLKAWNDAAAKTYEANKKKYGDAAQWVRYELQPAQSPDLNMLDLGAWRSLSTAVCEVKSARAVGPGDKPGNVEKRLVENCIDAWDRWWTGSVNTVNPLIKLGNSLRATMALIKANKGGNKFRTPHGYTAPNAK